MAPLNPSAHPFNVQLIYPHQPNLYYYYNHHQQDAYHYCYYYCYSFWNRPPLQQHPSYRVAYHHAYNHQAPDHLLRYYYHCGANDATVGAVNDDTNVLPSASGDDRVGLKNVEDAGELETSRGGCRSTVKCCLNKRRSRSSGHAISLGQQKKCPSIDFEFKEEEAARDNLTTLMIKNIPNKFDKKKILEMLDEHCMKVNKKLQDDDDGETQAAAALSEFDFLYLPIDFKTGCNYGYAFVNFTTPIAAIRLHRELHRKSWAYLGSRKICDVTCARIQGLGALLKHFSKSTFPCKSREYLPVHFTPNRNGLRVSTNERFIGSHIPRQQ